MDEKNIEVKITNGMLTIKGEKQEEKEISAPGFWMGTALRFRSGQPGVPVPLPAAATKARGRAERLPYKNFEASSR